MISFASKAKRLERSCVQLIKVKCTVFSEPVFCDLFSFTSRKIVSNQSSTLSRWLQRQSLTLSHGNPWWHRVHLFAFFMQITSDPIRSAKLLLDLKVVSGDFPSRSTYLRLLVKVTLGFLIILQETYQLVSRFMIFYKKPNSLF